MRGDLGARLGGFSPRCARALGTVFSVLGGAIAVNNVLHGAPPKAHCMPRLQETAANDITKIPVPAKHALHGITPAKKATVRGRSTRATGASSSTVLRSGSMYSNADCAGHFLELPTPPPKRRLHINAPSPQAPITVSPDGTTVDALMANAEKCAVARQEERSRAHLNYPIPATLLASTAATDTHATTLLATGSSLAASVLSLSAMQQRGHLAHEEERIRKRQFQRDQATAADNESLKKKHMETHLAELKAVCRAARDADLLR